MSRVKDIIGQKFNRLTVVSRAENSRHGNAMWNCLCDCGNMTVVLGSNLRNGEVKSCGCLLAEKNKARSTHGMTRTKLYQTWANMRRRCTDPKSKSYKDYGMRGIYVCDEWENSFEIFRDWAISHGYSEGLSIDRIDNDGPYAPWNCRWATHQEQDNNRRRCVWISYHGRTQNLMQWCKELNLDYKLIHNRMFQSGMSFEKAITMPLMKSRSHKQNKE